MKASQIFNGLCHYDTTFRHPTVASTEGYYPQDVLFVEAPDYVREGWGYDPAKEGDARFIEPVPPPHWLYDRETGTFDPDPDDLPPGFALDESGNIIRTEDE